MFLADAADRKLIIFSRGREGLIIFNKGVERGNRTSPGNVCRAGGGAAFRERGTQKTTSSQASRLG